MERHLFKILKALENFIKCILLPCELLLKTHNIRELEKKIKNKSIKTGILIMFLFRNFLILAQFIRQFKSI